MSIEGQKCYPGEMATPRQIMALASEYRLAADALLPAGRRGEPLSRSPYRLIAIHAIELYLNAYLVAVGRRSTWVRGLHHNFASCIEDASFARLNLRLGTLSHVRTLSETREYLTARYEPTISGVSELNRLDATLKDVVKKVTGYIDRSGAD